MNSYEAYSFLFSDSLFSNLALNAHDEVAVNTMSILGTYDIFYIFSVALLGSTISVLINYFFGMVAYKIYTFSQDVEMHNRYARISGFFIKYGVFVLLLSAIQPFGRFIILLSGFTRFGIVRTMLIAFPMKVMYYYYILYYI